MQFLKDILNAIIAAACFLVTLQTFLASNMSTLSVRWLVINCVCVAIMCAIMSRNSSKIARSINIGNILENYAKGK